MRQNQMALLVLALLFTTLFVSVNVSALEVWTWASNSAAMADVYDRFTKETGIKIELVLADGGAFGLRDKLLLGALGGQVPDVTLSHIYTIDELVNSGLVRDLVPYIEKTPEEYGLDKIPTGFFNTYMKNGKTYGIPSEMTSVILYYNKNLFAQAGLSYPNEQWRLTDEFIRSARALTVDTNGDGKPDQYGLQPTYLNQFVWLLWDVKVLNPTRSQSGFHDSRATQAFEWYSSLHNPNSVGPSWVDGKAAMMTNLNSPLRYSVGQKMDWDVTYLPLSPDGVHRTRAASSAWSIPTGAKNPDEAWTFIQFLYKKEIQQMLGAANAGVSRIDVLMDIWRKIDPTSSGFTQDSFKNCTVVPLSMQYAVADNYPTGWTTIFNDKIQPLINQVTTRTKPITELVAQMSHEIDIAIQK